MRSSARRLRAVALLGLVLAVFGSLGTACRPPVRVLIVGDSLTAGAASAGLGQQSSARWTIDAVVGRGTNAGIASLKARNLTRFDFVIVALGTNDLYDTTATYARRIDSLMAVVGSRPKVIWVEVDTRTPRLAPAVGVNAAIRAAPYRFPNLSVGRWDAYVAGYPGFGALRSADGIHYTRAGYVVRARWTEALVDP